MEFQLEVGLIFHRGMTEMEFMGAVDACFRFDTNEEYEEATRIACSISDNAVLMVGYQLASLSSHTPLDVNLTLLHIMETERPTPVILAAIPVIKSLLKGEKAAPEEVHNLLEICRQHGNAWNGLGIVECADKSLEETCMEIYASRMQKQEDIKS
jgi:hypothetical protein